MPHDGLARERLRWGARKREARQAAKVGYFRPEAKAWSREYDRTHPKSREA